VSPNGIRFGLRDEWEGFLARHVRFLEKQQSLTETFHRVFIREVETSKPADRVVFTLGRLAVEDFMEILLLCGNGYGIGGMKLLRGLYEKAVTLGYVAKNPDKAERFLEYHYVHQGKHFNHAKKAFSMDERLSASQIEKIESAYKEARQKFQEVLCKNCGTTRTSLSWSELDLLSMAREAGLDKLYLQCYYEPTLQAHTTFYSLSSKLRLKENGQVTFDEGAQHEKADLALIGAHHVIIYVLDTENNYFKMALENEIQERFADFMYVWKTD
jgi:hypothetical protein